MNQQIPTSPENSPTNQNNKIEEQIEAKYSRLLATFQVAAKILAVRLLLFLSVIGSFILAIIATNNQNPQSAYVLLLYAGVTTIPLSILEWLAWSNRSGG